MYHSVFGMTHTVCPWRLGYFLASPLRRLSQDPVAVLSPYVREGMIVLEPGPGMGFFTVELARMVGVSGRVVVVDIQPKMLASLRRRLAQRGLLDRVDVRLVAPESLGVADLSGAVDFVLAFAMVHELPDAGCFFREAAATLRPGGSLLLAEPRGHVKEGGFEKELRLASDAGLRLAGRPPIPRSHAALLLRG